MNALSERYLALVDQIAAKAKSCGRDANEITLVAVTKTQPVENMVQVYQAGCRHFGENRVQEALEKISALPQDIYWHLIGTLQSNKVNKAIESFSQIDSVDSLELAQKISIASQKKNVAMPILLQVNTSGEKSKHGLTAQEWRQHLDRINALPHIHLKGLMTMAPFDQEEKRIRACFSQLRQLREEFKTKVKDPEAFSQLSMGMSNDYLIAIEEGATLLRIGSALFGERAKNVAV